MSTEKSIALIGLLGIAFAMSGSAFAADATGAKPSASISGSVSDVIGRPLSNVVIRLQSENGKTVDITRTDSHGRFLFRAIAPGVYGSVYRFDQDTIGRLPQGADTPLRQVLLQAPGVSHACAGLEAATRSVGGGETSERGSQRAVA